MQNYSVQCPKVDMMEHILADPVVVGIRFALAVC